MTARPDVRRFHAFLRRDPDADRAVRADVVVPGAILTSLAAAPSIEAALRGHPFVATSIAALGFLAAFGTWRLARLWRERPLRATLALAFVGSAAALILAFTATGAYRLIVPLYAAGAAAQAWLGVARARLGVRDASPSPAHRRRELGGRAACVALGGWLVLLVAAGVWAPGRADGASDRDAARCDAPAGDFVPPFEW